MIIGVPKEIKKAETRVGLPPAGVETLIRAGHKVIVEASAGSASGFADDEYTQVGAQILTDAADVWEQAEMIVKVKEPLKLEWSRIRPGQILFTFFHFAAYEELTYAIKDSGCVAVTYETVTKADGELPLLTPMSEVAGRIAVQSGARHLESSIGGRGVLLGGVPGVPPGEVAILGGGVVGINAAKMAAGLGAHVVMLDISLKRLRYLSDVMPANVDTWYSNSYNIRKAIERADLLVGAVLVPGSMAPRLVTRDMLKLMKPRSVIVDVAIDQHGCIETIHETDWENPTYIVDEIIHYGVPNMPAAVPLTSTLALTNATIPYALEIANKGYRQAAIDNPEIRTGINIIDGKVTWLGVAEAFDLQYTPIKDALGM